MSNTITPAAEALADADAVSAKLLRAIAQELATRIIPQLQSGDALERASLARLILLTLAADIDVLPDQARKHGNALRALLAAQGAVGEMPAKATDRFEIAALRTAAARLIRDAAYPPIDATSEDLLRHLARWDVDWVLGLDDAATAIASPTSQIQTGTTAIESVNIESVSAYLQRHFPLNSPVTVTRVTPIPGGRSKKTFFVEQSGHPELPAEFVVRQDYALKYAGTKVVDEYGPLVALTTAGLPVPAPLHLEREPSELGPPFMFMKKFPGKPPGSYFGLATPCPDAFRDLARMLARLHQLDPDALGLPAAAGSRDALHELLMSHRQKWRTNTTVGSPLIDYAYAWADRECSREAGSSCFVHGDAGPYNFLIDNDRLQVILDWEFAHVGDPAEDLGVARLYAEHCMPWDEFMDIYMKAGGKHVSPRRIELGMLMQYLKGSMLVAASGRNYIEGGTHEFIKGASSFTGLRMIETRVARLLRRFGAV